MELLFREIAQYIALGLECAAVLVLLLGGIQSLVMALWPLACGRSTHGTRRAAWLNLARWLVLGLEFMLAADVVRSAIAPTWQEIGQLAAIAVIRTFLNFFLERDLETAVQVPEQT